MRADARGVITEREGPDPSLYAEGRATFCSTRRWLLHVNSILTVSTASSRRSYPRVQDISVLPEDAPCEEWACQPSCSASWAINNNKEVMDDDKETGRGLLLTNIFGWTMPSWASSSHARQGPDPSPSCSMPSMCLSCLKTGKSSPEARCIYSERGLVSFATGVGDLPAIALLAVHITHANVAHSKPDFRPSSCLRKDCPPLDPFQAALGAGRAGCRGKRARSWLRVAPWPMISSHWPRQRRISHARGAFSPPSSSMLVVLALLLMAGSCRANEPSPPSPPPTPPSPSPPPSLPTVIRVAISPPLPPPSPPPGSPSLPSSVWWHPSDGTESGLWSVGANWRGGEVRYGASHVDVCASDGVISIDDGFTQAETLRACGSSHLVVSDRLCIGDLCGVRVPPSPPPLPPPSPPPSPPPTPPSPSPPPSLPPPLPPPSPPSPWPPPSLPPLSPPASGIVWWHPSDGTESGLWSVGANWRGGEVRTLTCVRVTA